MVLIGQKIQLCLDSMEDGKPRQSHVSRREQLMPRKYRTFKDRLEVNPPGNLASKADFV